MRLVFVWDQIGPYHSDRLDAIAASCGLSSSVVGAQFTTRSKTYAWAQPQRARIWRAVTMCGDQDFESTHWLARISKLLPTALRGTHVFLAGYQRLDIFFAACVLRLAGRQVFMMNESKFDDKPRILYRELAKFLFCLPYTGALVGGATHRAYIEFLGFRNRPISTGYDTVGLTRVAAEASIDHVEPILYRDRNFIAVCRLVPKKNLETLIRAYAKYVTRCKNTPRLLIIVGDGPLDTILRALAKDLGISDKVIFKGFLQSKEVSKQLSRSLALLLISTEEQWGLVVNEAIAFDLPIILSFNVGCRETLLKSHVNGYCIEHDNIDGLAILMDRMSMDEKLWDRLRIGAAALKSYADTAMFSKGVIKLVS